MNDIEAVASAILSAQPSIVPLIAVGVIERVQAGGEAQVKFGFSPDLIPVPASSWTTTFAAQAATATGLRVLALFPDGQPLIVSTMWEVA